MLLEFIFAFVFGIIVGSFTNVCIYRMPRKESIVNPPSHCPKCDKTIRWFDNIPLFSWILLKGRCRYCGIPISFQYPLVELITGLIYIICYHYWGRTSLFFLYAPLFSAFLVISVIDFNHKIIPDIITLPGIVTGLLASFFLHQITFTNSIAGLLTGGGLFFIIALVSRGGMGGGDIKFMAMVGSFLGWKATLFTTFAGSFVALPINLLLIVKQKKGRKDQIPFGPFLVIGAALYVFFGDQIISWYLGL